MNFIALKSSQYRLYLIGNIFGMNANWILRLVIGWLAWDLTKSASFVGLISFLSFSPVLLGGPFFGVITDRVDIKRAAVVVQITVALLAVVLFVLLKSGLMTPLVLAIYAVVIGTVLSAYQPVRLSLGPRLVRPERISSVVSIGALNFNISRLTGPALGGALIAYYGTAGAIAVSCGLYLPFLLALSRLKPRAKTSQPVHLPMWQSFKQGLAFILEHRIIRIAFLVTGLFSLAIRAPTEVLPILADGVFAKGPTGLGLLTAAAGAGAFVASILQVSLTPPGHGRVPVRALLAALSGAALVLGLGVSTSWPVTVALVAGLGFASTIVGINFQSAVQTQLDDHMRGRVMSLWMTTAVGGTSLGALGVGALIDLVGPQWAFGGIGVLSLLVFAVLVPRVRD